MGKVGFQWIDGRADAAVQLNTLEAMLSSESGDDDDDETEFDEMSDECMAIPRMIAEFGEFMKNVQEQSCRSLTQFTPD